MEAHKSTSTKQVGHWAIKHPLHCCWMYQLGGEKWYIQFEFAVVAANPSEQGAVFCGLTSKGQVT